MWPSGWRRFRWRTLAIAAVVLLVVGLSIHWLVPPLLTSHRVQSEAEEARQHVDATRDQAMKVEANTLASDLFDRAAAKDTEAKQLTDARRFNAAIDVLREAAGRYEEALRVATPIREARGTADQTRTRMLAAKARAAPGASVFSAALAREQEGADRYQRLAFREAADKFLAAAQLFSKAVPPTVTEPVPAEPPGVDTHREIREVLRLYARVFEARDLDLLQRIRPRILPDELSRHRAVFGQTRSYRLNLRVDGITVSGDEAEARGRREDIVVAGNGETVRTPGQFIFRLKRVNNRWTIDAVK